MTLFYEFDNYDYEYEVEDKEVRKYIAEILAFRYGGNSKSFYDFIYEYEYLEEDLLEEMEDDIKEHFEEEAYEHFLDAKEQQDTPFSYYGLNEKDFH